MLKEIRIKNSLESGLAYIAGQQQKDGSFTSLSSPSPAISEPAKTYFTTFVPALILSCLSAPGMPEKSEGIKKPLAEFLLGQKSAGWSFNYWTRQHRRPETQTYPDDLDDTFCALTALYLYDPSIINEEVLVSAVKLLLATEEAVGGPYRTWLVPKDSKKEWLDIDLAVNANIACFLKLIGSPVPSVTQLMDRAIEAGQLESPYYPSAYPLLYYLARAYDGSKTPKLVRLARRLQAKAVSPLDQALCLTALLRLGQKQDLTALAQHLVESQAPDGSWPAAAFCIDPAVDKQTYFNGAPALTTAFAVEALSLYRQHLKSSVAINEEKTRDQHLEAVLAAIRQQSLNLDPALSQRLVKTIETVAKSSNGQEILTLASRFNQSLWQPLAPTRPDFFETLDLANLYGWLAYTVYDDFLDEEGNPQLLPSANVAMRRSLQCFYDALLNNRLFQSLVSQTFDAMDSANAWELTHCRWTVEDGKLIIDKPLPRYGDLMKLAERSMGHILAPLAVLVAKDVKPDSKAFQHIKEALSHYLIAKQLNDDAHDWQTDLQKGQATYVVAAILSDMGISAGSHRLDALLPRLQRQFWHHTLTKICREIQRHAKLSLESAQASGLMKSDSVITHLLKDVENAAETALASQAETIEFLKHYRQKVY